MKSSAALSDACPSCGKPKVEGPECPHCGVIYARFRGREAKVSPSASPAAPARDPPAPRSHAPHLPLARLELLLVTLAQAIEAGLTLHAYAHGPAAADLPPSIAERLRRAAAAGEPPSTVFADLALLDPAELAMLRAAERRAGEASALRLLARRCETRRADRRRLLIGLAYPGLLIASAILVRPLPALVLTGVGAYLAAIAPSMLGSILVGAALFLSARFLPRGARVWRPLRAAVQIVPPFSRIALHRARATFADVLGASITAGLTIRESIPLAAESAAHRGLATSPAVIARLDAGATLADALGELPALPSNDRALIAHGEQAGKLDEVLPRIAREHEQRARATTLATIVATIVLATIGVMGWMASAIVSGFTSQVQGVEQQIEQLMR
ncbi:MAG: type II secretion system F family protein [Deltaproteobacteria bacterium]|nr:type II secretion system F family protein [Deltaproteobacteria bacterium]